MNILYFSIPQKNATQIRNKKEFTLASQVTSFNFISLCTVSHQMKNVCQVCIWNSNDSGQTTFNFSKVTQQNMCQGQYVLFFFATFRGPAPACLCFIVICNDGVLNLKMMRELTLAGRVDISPWTNTKALKKE